MIKILVPTDFSDYAKNALDQAIEIANRAGGYIMLYHVYTVPSSTTGSFISVERFMQKDAENDMQRLVTKIKPQLNSKVILDTAIASGIAVKNICGRAENGGYDLIIMGTQGASGIKGIFMGSTAAGVMNQTKVSMLAIPSDAVFKPFNNIVLAMDENPIGDEQQVAALNQIMNIFSSKLTIFHLEMEFADAGIDKSVGRHFKESTLTTVKYDSNRNVNEMIDNFAKENNTDLLCVIRRKRGFIHEFFNPSVTKREIFHSDIPILILHD